jgi:hypothetical protein
MDETLETVKVKDERAPGGYYLINKSDFDPAIHALYEPPAEGSSAGDQTTKSEGDENAPALVPAPTIGDGKTKGKK